MHENLGIGAFEYRHAPVETGTHIHRYDLDNIEYICSTDAKPGVEPLKSRNVVPNDLLT